MNLDQMWALPAPSPTLLIRTPLSSKYYNISSHLSIDSDSGFASNAKPKTELEQSLLQSESMPVERLTVDEDGDDDETEEEDCSTDSDSGFGSEAEPETELERSLLWLELMPVARMTADEDGDETEEEEGQRFAVRVQVLEYGDNENPSLEISDR